MGPIAALTLRLYGVFTGNLAGQEPVGRHLYGVMFHKVGAFLHWEEEGERLNLI